MAFHQPTARHPINRPSAPVDLRAETAQDLVRSPNQQTPSPAAIEESQTWVLFSPNDDATTTTSYLSDSVLQSLDTPGRSHASELGSGSLNTVARSNLNSQPVNSVVRSVLSIEDDELDVLDSHLPEFRSAPQHQHQSLISQSIPVLPTHDGLGSFRLATTGFETEMQEHIYAFERFNPRRLKRRREAADLSELTQLEPLEAGAVEDDRNSRIEAWRQEQSQILLDAIKNETRKRRMSSAEAPTARSKKSDAGASVAAAQTKEANQAGGEWHEQDALAYGNGETEEGIWSRLARTVVRDLMGIDERVLSMLLWEAGPGEQDDDLSSTPRASTAGLAGLMPATGRDEAADTAASWQQGMLERIARELGLLVHRMSTHHPGAFSAYSRMQQTPLPYAGLPAIPEAGVAQAQDAAPQRRNPTDADVEYTVESGGSMPSVMMPQFRPTIAQQSQQVQPIPIPGRTMSDSGDLRGAEQTESTFTQEEWEQDLDIGLVFRYLRSRFTSRASQTPSSSTLNTRSSGHHSTASEAAARAARVRLYHPLVGRNQPRRSTNSAVGDAATPAAAVLHHVRQRSSGSCASQSTTGRAARRPSGTRRSGSFSTSGASRHSSRHYWDIGCGSATTGSMIASTGPMGSWGEV